MTVAENQRLAAKTMPASPTPRLDCDCLLGHILDRERSWLAAHGEENLSAVQQAIYDGFTAKRRQGLPVAYITGRKEFFGLDFAVTQDVLIPKPDTELLVEHAAEKVRHMAGNGRQVYMADICTGSGCIAVSVMRAQQENAAVYCAASDISQPALELAETNARRLLSSTQAKRIRFVRGDLLAWNLSPAAGCLFNLILANPPYIPTETAARLLKDGRGEPLLALDGGKNGLELIYRLVPQAFASLKRGGCFLLETGEYNAADAAAFLSECGFTDIVTYNDLAGQPRLTEAYKP